MRFGSRHGALAFGVLAALICIGLAACGCERDRDLNAESLETWRHRSWMSPEAKERIEATIKRYRDGVREECPILIQATLIDNDELNLFIYDETEDLLGIVIEEKRHDPNGNVTVGEEVYPVFAHFALPGIASCQVLRIDTRTEGRKKDETLWRDYLDMDFDALAEQAYAQWPGRHRSEGPWDDPAWQHRCEFYEETLPPVWMSTPEPNVLDVSSRVYDKAGNRSDPIRVLEF